ncbi:MAG: helix-turn-helix domain-containing protein [Sulfuritalea sp.]|nr:helix-turn-helix domain-containing protein [Sulfuritalea sp.]
MRQTREARGQSIADVVQVIRFSARQIEALERDDYASLPGSTAVRGLVRNYAKFLKLDATPLLAQLEPAVPVPEADVRPPPNMGEAEQSTIVERVQPRFVAAAVAILLLVLAGYWYSGLPGDGGLTSRLRGVEGSSGVVSPNSVATLAVVPMVAPAVVAGNQPANPTAATEASAGSGSLPFAGLRVEFDDRSWIEIRDATQKIVFVGEYPAGTRQNVEGKPPFQIWIGKASGVRLFMGERSIDLKPHIREEVARFSLE